MKKTLIVLGFLILASCSSTSKKNNQISVNNLDGDYSWVEDQEYTQDVPLKMSEVVDSFSEQITDVSPLAKESLTFSGEEKIEDAIDLKDDILGKIAGNCHSNEFEAAFNLIDKSYSKYKKHPGYWNQIGNCYYLSGDFKKAFLFYNSSKNIQGNYAPPINNLGVLYLKDNKYQKAMAAFEMALKQNPSSLTPKFNMAYLNLRFGFPEKACGLFSQIYNQGKKASYLINALATCSLIKNDINGSITYFQQLDEKLLEKPEYGINYALALNQAGQKKMALKVLDNIDLEKDLEVNTYFERVKKYVEKGN